MSITLGSLCKKILSNSFEETVLWLWTLKEKKKVNKNKNLELLLDATYFYNFHAVESLQALWVTQSHGTQKGLDWDSDSEGVISICQW